MKTVLMVVAVVKAQDKVLIRKMDPAKSPYKELWALFGGRIEGEGSTQELLNKELLSRWDFEVRISEKLWWDEEIKIDHDGEEKRFVYIDAICEIETGEPTAINKNETLEWVVPRELSSYDLNPPTRTLLQRLDYIG
jgi:ADP-ribose pyrophosphatase YjhB (NUDIX family)